MFNPLDPLGSLRDTLKDALKECMKFVQDFVINAPRPDDSGWGPVIYGNALGAAPLLATLIAVVLTVLTMVRHKLIPNTAYAFVVILVIGVLGQAWFNFVDWGVGFGTDLAKAAAFYDKEASASFIDVSGSLTIWPQIVGFIAAAGLSGMLAGVVLTYSVAVVFVKFVALLVYAASALGPRMRKLFDVVIAIGLVSIFFGRAAAVFALQLGKLAIDHIPLGNTAFGTTFFSVLSLFAAFMFQIGLVVICYNGVSQVTGRMHASITGSVTATMKSLETWSNVKIEAKHQQAIRAIPTDAPRERERTKTEALANKTAKGAAVVAVAATVLGQPEITAVAAATNRFAKMFDKN